MRLDHISIYTEDLERLKDFYLKYFAVKSNEKYHNISTGLQTYFLYFEDGARLELMQRPGLLKKDRSLPETGFCHLSFGVENRQMVDELTELLVKDGYILKSHPRITGDGYYESCILDPDGNEVEIIA